jgi:hypothetical protein
MMSDEILHYEIVMISVALIIAAAICILGRGYV